VKRKPNPIECSICGEPIEPFIDCGEWHSEATRVFILDDSSREYVPTGGPFHVGCMEHAALWHRIVALEKEVKALKEATNGNS
jgi:hypothetical protein